jgi:hypothetical protein
MQLLFWLLLGKAFQRLIFTQRFHSLSLSAWLFFSSYRTHSGGSRDDDYRLRLTEETFRSAHGLNPQMTPLTHCLAALGLSSLDPVIDLSTVGGQS